MLRELWDLIHPAKESSATALPAQPTEAERAKQSSVLRYSEALDRAPEVEAVTGALKYQHNRNHFAEMLELSMRPEEKN